VWKVSRLGRADVVVHTAKHSLQRRGIAMLSVSEQFDDSPQGDFIFALMSAQAALERSNIRQNVRAGMRRYALTKTYVNGHVPYGYRVEDHMLVVHEPDSKVIRRIFRLLADKGVTATVITDQLNASKTPWLKGREWMPYNVVCLLHSPLYKGSWPWDREGENIVRECPAIVSPELWQRAQEQLTKNRRYAGVRVNEYLLQGKVFCGLCGRAMSGCFKKANNFRYYRCSTKIREIKTPCVSRYVYADQLEETVFNQLRTWVLETGSLEQDVTTTLEQQGQEHKEQETYLAELQDKALKNDKARQRVLRL
jgi:site-specific DNA recombinase